MLLVAGMLAAPAAAREPAVRDTAPVPLLWKVSDADNAVYLLGSFHLLRPDDYPLSADVDVAFAAADSLLFELAPDEVDSGIGQDVMLRAARRSDGSRLGDELDATMWRKLQAYAAAHGLPLASLEVFKPWFVALTISIAEMTDQGLDPELGLDKHFMDAARRTGKPATGLERIRDQIGMLDGMDALEQRQLLAEALDEAAKGPEQTARLHDAWRRGDAARLWNEMAMQMQRDYPRLYRRINVERNDRWLPQIAQRLEGSTDDTMVVVGALHLLGEDGLVEKLRRKGYRVERICSACAMPVE